MNGAFGDAVPLFASREHEIERARVGASETSDLAFGTLDETIWATVRRDCAVVRRNCAAVLLPMNWGANGATRLREWDLWGPLAFVLTLSATLSGGAANASRTMRATTSSTAPRARDGDRRDGEASTAPSLTDLFKRLARTHVERRRRDGAAARDDDDDDDDALVRAMTARAWARALGAERRTLSGRAASALARRETRRKFVKRKPSNRHLFPPSPSSELSDMSDGVSSAERSETRATTAAAIRSRRIRVRALVPGPQAAPTLS